MMPVIQKIVGGGVVVNNGKVLIIQRDANDSHFPGLWEIPSGKKEDLEDIKECIKREVNEEVGLNVNLLQICNAFTYTVAKNGSTYDVTQVSYVVKSVNGNEVKLSNEHDNFAWIAKDELDKYNISDETKDTIRKAFDITKNF